MLTVSEIIIYPVKSGKGISLSEARIVATGFDHDREWMVVTPSGDFLTQRQNPKMAVITAVAEKGQVRLMAPGKEEIVVPIKKSGEKIVVKIWGDACEAIDQGPEVQTWLTKFLDRECRLVRMSPEFKRKVKQKYAVSPQDIVGFADGYPFLLISETSLADLNSRLKDKVPMNRFRPNIVISGGTPYQEDSWKRIKVGKVELAIVKPCARCEITTVDQVLGVITGSQPREELEKYRSSPKGPLFGQNVIHLTQGVIKVGDVVEVVA